MISRLIARLEKATLSVIKTAFEKRYRPLVDFVDRRRDWISPDLLEVMPRVLDRHEFHV
jgi:hypothetical protein